MSNPPVGLDEPAFDGAQPLGGPPPQSPDGDAILALEILYRRTKDQFERDGTVAAFSFGWREPPRQSQSVNRLVWVPGDPSAKLGEVNPPKYPGRLPERPLASLAELFTVYVLTSNVARPGGQTDELVQYRSARLMLDALVRAMALSFTLGSQLVIRSAEWLTEKDEKRFGTGIRLVGAILAVIPDAAVTLAPVDTHALAVSSELDISDPAVRIDPT